MIAAEVVAVEVVGEVGNDVGRARLLGKSKVVGSEHVPVESQTQLHDGCPFLGCLRLLHGLCGYLDDYSDFRVANVGEG